MGEIYFGAEGPSVAPMGRIFSTLFTFEGLDGEDF